MISRLLALIAVIASGCAGNQLGHHTEQPKGGAACRWELSSAPGYEVVEESGPVEVVMIGDATRRFTLQEAAEVFGRGLVGRTRIVVVDDPEALTELYTSELKGRPNGVMDVPGGFVLLTPTIYNCSWRRDVARVVVMQSRCASLDTMKHEWLHSRFYQTRGHPDFDHLDLAWESLSKEYCLRERLGE